METFDTIFELFKQYRVLRCRACRYAIPPTQVNSHIAEHHKNITRETRQELYTYIRSLTCLATRIEDVQYPPNDEPAVAGFPVYEYGVRCDGTTEKGSICGRVYQTVRAVQEHCKEEHSWTNLQKRGGDKRRQQTHTSNKLWKEGITYQYFFRVPAWKRAFEVGKDKGQRDKRKTEDRKAFFESERKRIEYKKQQVEAERNIIQGFDSHRSSTIPWLQKTGIANHLRGLKKDEISLAISMPRKGEETQLELLCDRIDALVQRARVACSDSEDCELSWPCKLVLANFAGIPQEGTSKIRAFDPDKHEDTVQKYSTTLKRLICYVRRVALAEEGEFFTRTDSEQTIPEDTLQLSDKQLSEWADAEDNSQLAEEEQERAVVALLTGLIRQQIGARRYRSPILSFCALLAIQPTSGEWMEAGNFNSYLSGLIWIVQLVVFYSCLLRSRAGEGGVFKLLQRECKEYLRQTRETPIGEVLRWRLLLFAVSKNTVGTREATWDLNEQVLTYEGVEFDIEGIPRLLESVYEECTRLLEEDLLLGNRQLRRMTTAQLKENDAVRTPGWYFGEHEENQRILKGTDSALLNTIAQSERLSRVYTAKDQWRDSAVAAYEDAAQAFLERLCVLVHIAGGQPLRENELFSVTWKNTQRKRAVTIRLERVMIHTQYDKMQATTGRYKENVRFLPNALGGILLDYLVYVQPFREILGRSVGRPATPYLWESGGKVWPAGKLSRCLEDASARAGIPRLHISNWRQMTVAITKTKFASEVGVFAPEEAEEDMEEMEEDIRAMTRQRNHSTRTANLAYANQGGSHFGGVWDGLIRIGYRASTLWQDFWRVDTAMRGRKRAVEEDGRLTKRLATGIYRPRAAPTEESLLQAMRRLYKRPDAEWRSAAQRDAVRAVAGTRDEVVVVIPTGAGKSLTFMLPCTLDDAACTALIVPLVGLRADLIRRLGELGIRYLEWTGGERREAPLVVVSIEAAASKDFRVYAQALTARRRLDRIVVDECHLTVTAREYRDAFAGLAELRALRTQFVYLTATMPPAMWAEFKERNALVDPVVVRAASHRPNLEYAVYQIPGQGEAPLTREAAEAARTIAEDHAETATDKVILYVRTRAEAEALAREIQCPAYTSKAGTPHEKAATLADWTAGGQPYLVATSALAEGFDYPRVRAVICVNEPDSPVLFAQQAGRAGRDGRKAYAAIILPGSWRPTEDHGKDEDEDDKDDSVSYSRDRTMRRAAERGAMHRLLSRRACIRTSLSEYLDEEGEIRRCSAGDQSCSVCNGGQEPAQPTDKEAETQAETSRGGRELARLRRAAQLELDALRERAAAVRGQCLACRVCGEDWGHSFRDCARFGAATRARSNAVERGKRRGGWLRPYAACFRCLLPQSICPSQTEQCKYRDLVLPLCYGLYVSPAGPTFLRDTFHVEPSTLEQYLDWLGEGTEYGGGPAVQAVRVTAAVLSTFEQIIVSEPPSRDEQPQQTQSTGFIF